jgi:hypothetical protein
LSAFAFRAADVNGFIRLPFVRVAQKFQENAHSLHIEHIVRIFVRSCFRRDAFLFVVYESVQKLVQPMMFLSSKKKVVGRKEFIIFLFLFFNDARARTADEVFPSLLCLYRRHESSGS